ncbi:helicase-associated domain-containing protein [Thermopolyspora sp. NPDC052614]|uniref:helicase-associated domain-containing protein n=1 Tax=Thermopolyspora sp. NPDC052614 TaxID=3155682 RepID=UPI003437FDFC
MSTERRLADWLSTRTPEQQAAIFARAELVMRGNADHDAAHLLLRHPAATALIAHCTLPETQVLAAVVWLAEQAYGPFQEGYWSHDDPARRAVPRADVLDIVGGSDPELRSAAEAVLAALQDAAVVLPPHGDQVIVSNLAHLHLGGGLGLGRTAGELMAAYLNAGEVHRVADALGLPKAPNRDTAERAVLATLADPERVLALLAEAPEGVVDWAREILEHGSRLRTLAFRPLGGLVHLANPRYAYAAGKGDAATDWLAARGLLLPAGLPDMAELPREVAVALLGGVRAPFAPHPPEPPAEPPAPVDVDGSAQAAAIAAAAQIDRLLAACAAQPLGLRKAGGVAVRETKRAAKAAGVEERVARLWLDLCAQADLLGVLSEQPQAVRGRRGRQSEPPSAAMPTTAYDDWLRLPPAERLAPIIAAWASANEIFTYWPDPEETRVALVRPADWTAVGLRHGVLEALDAAPGAPVPYVLERARWHRPHQVSDGPQVAERVLATLNEAELLGVVAHGALTRVGRAVLDLLRGGRPWRAADESLRQALTELLPRARSTAVFQADLTAMAGGTPAPELAELLDAAADRESEGHAVVWRFTPATIRRALDSGHTADGLLTRLADVAESPLPQPLEYLIKDVGRTHGRMRVVRSGCCIRSDDEALLDELVRARALRTLRLRRIAPTVLISSAPERETLDGLRAAGYAPILESETGTTVIEKVPQRRAPTRS